nr:MAG TPA: hypothetical protein [Caudoviricetes sp.]
MRFCLTSICSFSFQIHRIEAIIVVLNCQVKCNFHLNLHQFDLILNFV